MLHYWKIDYNAVHDGPGIRTSFYFKGCPLRCAWCANPESQTPGVSILYKANLCALCGACVRACPGEALSLNGQLLAKDPALCTDCGRCGTVCPHGAMETIGKEISIEEILRILEQNRPLYRRTGGGITLTGGDPMFQGPEIVALIKACRSAGFHVAMESSGFAPAELFAEACKKLNLLFFDLKHMDPGTHTSLTGRPNELIQSNLELASRIFAESGQELVFRFVVVPGHNDGDNLKAAASRLAALPYLTRVELLRYHSMGALKYGQLFRNYSLPELVSPDDEAMARAREPFLQAGLPVI